MRQYEKLYKVVQNTNSFFNGKPLNNWQLHTANRIKPPKGKTGDWAVIHYSTGDEKVQLGIEEEGQGWFATVMQAYGHVTAQVQERHRSEMKALQDFLMELIERKQI